uniref:Uncharacterized protein n=1 Tax=Leersia perrieri TaxID=77586 RepID=A0A0D9XBM6_9ORYZ
MKRRFRNIPNILVAKHSNGKELEEMNKANTKIQEELAEQKNAIRMSNCQSVRYAVKFGFRRDQVKGRLNCNQVQGMDEKLN